MHARVINKILEQPDYLTQVPLRTLQNWVNDYPYVALFRVLLAKKLQDKDAVQFKSSLQNASFFTNDRLLLYQFMQKELIIPDVDYNFLHLLENPEYTTLEQEINNEEPILESIPEDVTVGNESLEKIEEIQEEVANHISEEEIPIENLEVLHDEVDDDFIQEEKIPEVSETTSVLTDENLASLTTEIVEADTKLDPAEEIMLTLRKLQEARKKLSSITGEHFEDKEKILHEAEHTLEVVERSMEKARHAHDVDSASEETVLPESIEKPSIIIPEVEQKELNETQEKKEEVEEHIEASENVVADLKEDSEESEIQQIITDESIEETAEINTDEEIAKEEIPLNESILEEAFIQELALEQEDYQSIATQNDHLDTLEETEEVKLAEVIGEPEEELLEPAVVEEKEMVETEVDAAPEHAIVEKEEWQEVQEQELATLIEEVAEEEISLSEKINATKEWIAEDEYLLAEALGEPQEETLPQTEETYPEIFGESETTPIVKEIIVDSETHSFMEWLQLLENQVVVQKIETHKHVEEIKENPVEEIVPAPEPEEVVKEVGILPEETTIFEAPTLLVEDKEPEKQEVAIPQTKEKQNIKKEKKKEKHKEKEPKIEQLPLVQEVVKKEEVIKTVPKVEVAELDERILPVKGRIKRDQEVDRLATESVSFNKELASETLAMVFASQGKKMKAIEVYKILILKFPNKKRYFASQIKKLQE
ncbi:MAG: hypothetical protein K1X55_13810 [Chitinophagales bacterium]|nr:hypothetical protein [Chitinophagales bacterium]